MINAIPPIGDLIREWRQRRRLSQSDLAFDAEISTKHLSSLESGRARPNREIVLRLAERLAIPLRDRNIILRAAGFAPVYQERPLDDPGFRQTRQSIDLILNMHDPNPAMAVDRHWTMAASNQAIAWLVSGVDQLLLRPPVNVIRLNLHPAGLAPRIINLAEWRQHLTARLRLKIQATGDPVLMDLVEEISSYPLPAGPHATTPDFNAVAVPLRLATVHGPLAFFGATTVFDHPVDITLAELAIEAFFPADLATAAVLRQTAAQKMPAAAPPTLPVPSVTRRLAPLAATG